MTASYLPAMADFRALHALDPNTALPAPLDHPNPCVFTVGTLRLPQSIAGLDNLQRVIENGVGLVALNATAVAMLAEILL